jgi:glycerol kinase
LPITGIAGDQQAATIGQACFEPGMVKSTYGTGCFVLFNTGPQCQYSGHKLLSTIAYEINDHKHYAIEGSIFNAGTAIQWLRDGLGIIKDAKETQELAESVENTDGVYFIPAFTGLGAPYWDSQARGTISGITRDTNKAHIVRATLEAQAYQTRDLLEAMQKDSGGEKIQALRVDGGMVKNDFVCQWLADILQIPVERPVVIETTALGAAYCAGLGVGLYKGLEDISSAWALDKRFEPNMEAQKANSLYQGWKEAVQQILK